MFDDLEYYVITVSVFFGLLFLGLFIAAENKLPDEIKDTNCIYYEN